jgi:acylphosphatase
MLEMILIVHGQVQGVGYRYSIMNFIDDNHLMVKGYIHNQPNGTVKIVVQGDIETLKDIRRFAVTGPERSVVRDIEETISEIKEYSYSEFSIKY